MSTFLELGFNLITLYRSTRCYFPSSILLALSLLGILIWEYTFVILTQKIAIGELSGLKLAFILGSLFCLLICEQVQTLLWVLFLVTTLISLCLLLPFDNLKNSNFMLVLARRSFSLYAIHWPILVLLNYSIFRDSEVSPIIYLPICFLAVAVVTEMFDRWVENPSLRQSRKILLNNAY